MAKTGAKTILEEAPVASKGSSGVVERAVQTVERFFMMLTSQWGQQVRRQDRHEESNLDLAL